MINSFAEFVAPLPAEDFLDEDRRGGLGILHGVSANAARGLMDWDRMVDVAVDLYDPDLLHLALDRERVPPEFLQTAGKTDRDKVERLLRRGASILMAAIHRYDDGIKAIKTDFSGLSGKPARIGVIGSTGEKGAFVRHFDQTDIFVLQVSGAKLWRIYDPRDDGKQDPVFDRTLKPGEYLFVPQGYPHECDNIEGRSLHIVFMFAKGVERARRIKR